MLLTLILAVALSVGTLIFLVGRFFSVPQDRLEPTLIQSTIPVVGHAINLLRHGTGYYSHIMYVSDITLTHISEPPLTRELYTGSNAASPSSLSDCPGLKCML